MHHSLEFVTVFTEDRDAAVLVQLNFMELIDVELLEIRHPRKWSQIFWPLFIADRDWIMQDHCSSTFASQPTNAGLREGSTCSQRRAVSRQNLI